jgi:hypothetical protein
MTGTKRLQLATGLVLVSCVCELALGAELNKKPTGIMFESNLDTQIWYGKGRSGLGRGPAAPTHAAVMYVWMPDVRPNRPLDLPKGDEGIRRMLNTPPGKSLSGQQREFLRTSDAMAWHHVVNMKDHSKIFLYAVSSADVKKMARAFLEVGIENAKDAMQDVKSRLRSYEEKVAKIRKELPKMEAELKAVTAEYEEAMRETHSPLSEADTAEESRKIILEMNTILDSLAIDITGIEAKLSAVKKIKAQKTAGSAEGLARLEDIVSEQTIELAGSLARKKAAISIREREEKYYNLYKRRLSLAKQVGELKKELRNAENYQKNAEQWLADPEPNMLPPQVYQNKVTIHPATKK